jgi:hypothetical protein
MPHPFWFDQVWRSGEGFAPPAPVVEPGPSICPYAQQFRLWAQELGADLGDRPTIVAVNQKKILLVDKYFDWRTVLPKSHRNRTGEHGHRCVWHVFEETYLQLKAVELALTPPLLFLPEKPPRPPKPLPPQAGGIFLGEIGERSRG